jgi:hypothetical protein
LWFPIIYSVILGINLYVGKYNKLFYFNISDDVGSDTWLIHLRYVFGIPVKGALLMPNWGTSMVTIDKPLVTAVVLYKPRGTYTISPNVCNYGKTPRRGVVTDGIPPEPDFGGGGAYTGSKHHYGRHLSKCAEFASANKLTVAGGVVVVGAGVAILAGDHCNAPILANFVKQERAFLLLEEDSKQIDIRNGRLDKIFEHQKAIHDAHCRVRSSSSNFLGTDRPTPLILPAYEPLPVLGNRPVLDVDKLTHISSWGLIKAASKVSAGFSVQLKTPAGKIKLGKNAS